MLSACFSWILYFYLLFFSFLFCLFVCILYFHFEKLTTIFPCGMHSLYSIHVFCWPTFYTIDHQHTPTGCLHLLKCHVKVLVFIVGRSMKVQWLCCLCICLERTAIISLFNFHIHSWQLHYLPVILMIDPDIDTK